MAGIDSATETLNKAWEAASQDLYNAQQAQGQAQPGAEQGEPTTANAGNDAAQDVDFEEVK
jgi:molecular chaperone DnaK